MSQNNISPVSSQTGATSKLDAALDLARHGLPIFPLVANSKVPLIEGWQHAATADVDQIRAWWKANPRSNIGIHTANFLVVDIDPRKGGDASFDILRMTEDFPDTVAASTQSGGVHLIYALPAHTVVRGGADKLAQGIDVKSYGGFIVGAGSAIDGRPYTWTEGCSPADRKPAIAPQWLIDRCAAPRKKTLQAGQRVIEEDEISLDLAVQYIETFAPHAALGELNDKAYAVACRLFDFGVAHESAKGLLRLWSDIKCEPELQDDTISHVVSSASRYRGNAIGSRHPNAPGFEPYEMSPASPVKPQPRVLHYIGLKEGAEQAFSETGQPLIKGILDRGAMSVWYGESNSGKTFVALDVAHRVAAGGVWCDRKVHQAATVYIAAEGSRGFKNRLAALVRQHPDEEKAPLFAVPCPVNLGAAGPDVTPLIKIVRDIEREKSVKVELIVIDTLSRVLSGGDENASTDMGALVKNFDRIRTETGAHVAIIHHTGKDKARGARGHSLLRAATDTEIEIDGRTVTITKQRDLEGGQRFSFTLKPVRLGTDTDGDPITSCVVEIRDRAGSSEPLPLPAGLQPLFDAMKERIHEDCERDGVEIDQRPFGWEFVMDCAHALKSRGKLTAVKGLSRSNINDKLTVMTESGAVRKIADNQYVIATDGEPPSRRFGKVHDDGVTAHLMVPSDRQAPTTRNSQARSTGGRNAKAA